MTTNEQPSAESDAPEWCPFKGRCAHPDCLLDLDQCASALMASGSRRDFPMAPVRRPRRVLPPEVPPKRRRRGIPLDPDALAAREAARVLPPERKRTP